VTTDRSLKICWRNVELLLVMSPLDCGATSSDRNSRPGYVGDIRDTVIRFSLMRFLSRLTVNNIFSGALWKIVTDKLRSYGVAHRELMPATIHSTEKYANNRAALSHQPTRVRERGMRRFKSVKQAQRFLNIHAAVYNLFNLARHLGAAETYRYFRLRSFASWKNAAMV
jgi:hypothetical protein